ASSARAWSIICPGSARFITAEGENQQTLSTSSQPCSFRYCRYMYPTLRCTELPSISSPPSGHIAMLGSAAPTTSSSELLEYSSVFQWQHSLPKIPIAERPLTKEALLVVISSELPLRNSVTSPVERTTSAASSGVRNKPSQ